VGTNKAAHVHVVALLNVISRQAVSWLARSITNRYARFSPVMDRIQRYVEECNMCAIKHLAWIPVEEVLELEDWSIAHWVPRQGFDELSVTAVDGL
jgi:hypothetical protein